MSPADVSPSRRAARTIAPGELSTLVGTEIGISDWLQIDQRRINAFADVTLDRQFIHVDPARALAGSPFGGTIAHGFLVLSLLTHLTRQLLPRVEGADIGINYGFNRVRFLTPVPAGSRVRARSRLLAATMKQPGTLLESEVTVEIDGNPKPALVANWLTLLLPHPKPIRQRDEDSAS